jgi:hypothetical protein
VPPHVKLLLELKEQREELRALRAESKAFFLEMPTKMMDVVQRCMGAVPTATFAGVQIPSGAAVSFPQIQAEMQRQLEPVLASLRALEAALPTTAPVRYEYFAGSLLMLCSKGPRKDRVPSFGAGACVVCPGTFRCPASLCRPRFDFGALARTTILHFGSWSLWISEISPTRPMRHPRRPTRLFVRSAVNFPLSGASCCPWRTYAALSIFDATFFSWFLF